MLPLIFLRERKYTTLFNLKNNSFSFFLNFKLSWKWISKRRTNIQLLFSYETFFYLFLAIISKRFKKQLQAFLLGNSRLNCGCKYSKTSYISNIFFREKFRKKFREKFREKYSLRFRLSGRETLRYKNHNQQN